MIKDLPIMNNDNVFDTTELIFGTDSSQSHLFLLYTPNFTTPNFLFPIPRNIVSELKFLTQTIWSLTMNRSLL